MIINIIMTDLMDYCKLSLNDNLEPEKDDGNIEYKYALINLTENMINKKATQMKYRIYEGLGEALYFIGVTDDGILLGLNKDEYLESVANLEIIAQKIDCSVIKLIESNKNDYYVGEFLIRENYNNYIDLKIGVAGNVDSGKTTTIGTLTKNILDDGRGKARISIFNHKHEIDSGRTSSISHQIMGFDSYGNIVNSKNSSWSEISNNSTKVVSFYDMAGHEKYLKTTIYGLSSIYPDYCFIMIGANMGINHMTREHILLLLNLKIPFIILVTKIDIVPENILEETMQKINNMCKNRIRKIPYIIKNTSDVINTIKNIKSDGIVPIMQISNVSNYNLDLLRKLLNLLPIRNDYSKYTNGPVEFIVDNMYSVIGHPTIVSGIIKSGTIHINDTLLIGPFSDLTYKSVKIRTIHLNYKDVKDATAGKYYCISLKGITRKELKKGMIMLSEDNTKIAVREFTAMIQILHSPTMIKTGYQPFVHIEHIKQSVKMVHIKKINSKIDDDLLRTGDKAEVKLEFIIKPEYIKPNMRIIFREGKVKAVGKVILI